MTSKRSTARTCFPTTKVHSHGTTDLSNCPRSSTTKTKSKAICNAQNPKPPPDAFNECWMASATLGTSTHSSTAFERHQKPKDIVKHRNGLNVWNGYVQMSPMVVLSYGMVFTRPKRTKDLCDPKQPCFWIIPRKTHSRTTTVNIMNR